MRRLLFLLLLSCAVPALAASSTDVPPPPTVKESSGVADPEVRVVQKGDQRIEEYRLNGKLYMMKVTPGQGTPYFLQDAEGSGQMQQVDPAQRVMIPNWVLMRF